jgi:hypothetical protein
MPISYDNWKTMSDPRLDEVNDYVDTDELKERKKEKQLNKEKL